jgi:acetyl-CoA synthetase
VLKAVILDRDPGDITTIEDEGSVDEARRAWTEMRAEIAAQRRGAESASPGGG